MYNYAKFLIGVLNLVTMLSLSTLGVSGVIMKVGHRYSNSSWNIWLVFDGLNLKGKTSKKKEVLNNEFRNGYAGT